MYLDSCKWPLGVQVGDKVCPRPQVANLFLSWWQSLISHPTHWPLNDARRCLITFQYCIGFTLVGACQPFYILTPFIFFHFTNALIFRSLKWHQLGINYILYIFFLLQNFVLHLLKCRWLSKSNYFIQDGGSHMPFSNTNQWG